MTRSVQPILFFFFNDTATTEIYTLSLHDALPISAEAVLPDLADAPDRREDVTGPEGTRAHREVIEMAAPRPGRRAPRLPPGVRRSPARLPRGVVGVRRLPAVRRDPGGVDDVHRGVGRARARPGPARSGVDGDWR